MANEQVTPEAQEALNARVAREEQAARTVRRATLIDAITPKRLSFVDGLVADIKKTLSTREELAEAAKKGRVEELKRTSQREKLGELDAEEVEVRAGVAETTGLPAAAATTTVKAEVSGVFGTVQGLGALNRDARKLAGEIAISGVGPLMKAINPQIQALAEKHHDFDAQLQGTQDSLAEAQVDAQLLEEQHATVMVGWNTKLDRFALEAQYPGVPGGISRIEQLQGVIEDQRRDPTVEGVTAAMAAQTELERGQQVDQGRLLGPVENQIMAAIAIGFGALGSALSGLPNYGMDMVNAAIEKDIAAQRNRFRLKGETYARNRNLYELVQRQFDSEWERSMALRGFYLQKSAIIARQMGAVRAEQQILSAQKRDAFNTDARNKDRLVTMRSRALTAEIEIKKINMTLEAKRNEGGPSIKPAILMPIEHALTALHSTMRLEEQFWKLGVFSGPLSWSPGNQTVYKKQVELHGFKIARSEQSNRVTEKDREVSVDVVPGVWATRWSGWQQWNNMYANAVENVRNKIGFAKAGGHNMESIERYVAASLKFTDQLIKQGDDFTARADLLSRRGEEMLRGADTQWEARQQFMQDLHEMAEAKQASGGSFEEIDAAKTKGRSAVIGGAGTRR